MRVGCCPQRVSITLSLIAITLAELPILFNLQTQFPGGGTGNLLIRKSSEIGFPSAPAAIDVPTENKVRLAPFALVSPLGSNHFFVPETSALKMTQRIHTS
jgi:hypothetical protein